MLSGILGTIVIGFKRIPRHKLRQHLFTFIRINSTFVTFVAAICTLLASTFAIMHLMNIMSPNAFCRPIDGFTENSECTCTLNNTINNSTSAQPDHGKFIDGISYRYDFWHDLRPHTRHTEQWKSKPFFSSTETWAAAKWWEYSNTYWLHRRYSTLPVFYYAAYYWYCCVYDINGLNVFRIVRQPVEIVFKLHGAPAYFAICCNLMWSPTSVRALNFPFIEQYEFDGTI